MNDRQYWKAGPDGCLIVIYYLNPMKDRSANLNSRRQFLNTSVKASALLAIPGNSLLAEIKESMGPAFKANRKSAHPLKILILGGTSFLGPHQIAYAMGRGHSISIFTRGKTNPTIYKKLFKKVEHLVGDRTDNLEALKGRTWDAVIDNSGHRAQWTKDTAELLKDNVDLYLYTSSTGVFYPYLGSDITESTQPVLVVPEGLNEDQSLEYGYVHDR